MPRATIPLAVGRGMDRATGLVQVQPQAPVDTQNVYARDAKMAVRPGLGGTIYPPLQWGTDILAIVPIKATGDELFAVYDRTSREIRIFRLDPDIPEMQELLSPPNGLWGTLSALADFPVVTAAEADGIVFFAHDEGEILFRLETVYYTPNFASPDLPGTLTVLTANLVGDGGTDDPVYFRGVIAYLDYMCGWGFGNTDDPDRGDILRLSLPTQPTIFSPENYAIFGAKKDPIRGCIPTVDVLAVGKGNESYKLVGTNPDTFIPVLLDARYGVVSSRCAVNIGGIGYWWSIDGARQVMPDGTQPIAQPLELISPLPADFPDLGPSRTCFVTYDRRRYLLEWLFPTLETAAVRTPTFALSLWNPKDPRWTFFVREQCLGCAGEIFVSDDAVAPAPTGYVSAVSGTDVGIASDARYRSVRLDWTNNGALGDETVEIYAKPDGGAWSVVLSVPVSGATQSATVSTLLPLTKYFFGLKYVRGTRSAAGYSGDPDSWTAGTAADSQTDATTTSDDVAWVSGDFVDASTPVNLQWSSAQLEAPYLLEKDPGTGFVTVVADYVGTSYPYTIPPAELGTTVTFRVTAQRGAIVGPVAVPDLDVPMFLTIGTPAWISAVWSAPLGYAALHWSAASHATSYFLEKTTDGGASWSPVATIGTTTYNYVPVPAELNTTVGFRVTGKNGATSGPTSTTQNVTFTVNLPAPTNVVPVFIGGDTIQVTWTPGGGDGTQQFVIAYVDPVLDTLVYGQIVIADPTQNTTLLVLSGGVHPYTAYVEVWNQYAYSGGGLSARSARVAVAVP